MYERVEKDVIKALHTTEAALQKLALYCTLRVKTKASYKKTKNVFTMPCFEQEGNELRVLY